MGFNEVLSDWRAAGRAADASHGGSARNTFRGRYPQADWNLDKDRRVTDLQRESLLTVWLACAPEQIDELERAYEDLCHNQEQRKGPRRRLRPEQVLGHCIPNSVMVDRLSDPNREEFMLRPQATTRMAAFLDQSLGGQRRFLGRYGIRDHLMWSCYEAAATGAPFSRTGTTQTELHRRLGLGHYDLHDDRLLYMKHRLPAGVDALVPTAFDAGTSPYFEHGGRSKPLAGPKRDGVNEAVHSPIPGSAIVSRVAEAG